MNVGALAGIRLRTPRLELRLPSEDELVELFRVAEGGIHPPDEEEILAASGTMFHPSCTCAMGSADDPMAVVDPECRVEGVEEERRGFLHGGPAFLCSRATQC